MYYTTRVSRTIFVADKDYKDYKDILLAFELLFLIMKILQLHHLPHVSMLQGFQNGRQNAKVF